MYVSRYDVFAFVICIVDRNDGGGEGGGGRRGERGGGERGGRVKLMDVSRDGSQGLPDDHFTDTCDR